MNFEHYEENEDAICPRCQSEQVHVTGYAWHQRIFCQCNKCLWDFKIPWQSNYEKFDFTTGLKWGKN